jgi:SRSO17 transposase
MTCVTTSWPIWGTPGRIENAQVAVYLTYAAPAGYAFIDRAVYLPRCWTDDPDRCAAAGIPAETAFATKPALARQMITAAVAAGVPVRWVTGDEVYGADPHLRADLVGHGLGYVLAVAAHTGSSPRRGRSPPRTWPGGFPATPGSRCLAESAPRACVGMTGR